MPVPSHEAPQTTRPIRLLAPLPPIALVTAVEAAGLVVLLPPAPDRP